MEGPGGWTVPTNRAFWSVGEPWSAWVGAAVAGAGRLVLVGPERPELPRAITVREDPPGAGPVPALRAGLAPVRAPWVAVLAADLPFLRAEHVDELRRAAYGGPGPCSSTRTGARSGSPASGVRPTCAAPWPRHTGASLRGLMDPLEPVRVRPPAGERPWYDCDTPADVEAASRMIGENSA